MDVVKVLLCHADGAQTPVSVEDLAEHIARQLVEFPSWTVDTITDAVQDCA